MKVESDHFRAHVDRVLDALSCGVNAITGTVHAALVVTDNARYAGVSYWLSGTSNIHAEQAAIAAAVSAGDPEIHALLLAQGRVDGREAGLPTPCGSCAQLIHDHVTFTGRAITIYAVDAGGCVKVIRHCDLLPHAFTSQHLAAAGAARRAGSPA